MKFKFGKILCVISLAAFTSAYADAPVVDLSGDGSSPSSQASSSASSLQLSGPERIARLEQQMSNYNQMNLPARIDELQQQVAQLQGDLEVAQHTIQTLTEQQRSFYQDLDQRITALSGSGKASANTTSSSTTNSSAATTTTAASQTEQAAYQTAFDLLGNKKYDKAISALQNYLTTYPKGEYVANAHYWLGEVYFMQKKNDDAAQEFNTIITQFPKDPKVPDAKLKMAFINDANGKHKLAKQQLESILKLYPNTPVAQLAKLRLKTLGSS